MAKFPGIIAHLKEAGPHTWQKQGHWAWYVFPTTDEGKSDIKRTAVKNIHDAIFVLDNNTTRDMWTSVLVGITDALRAQRTRNILPSIDHGRVGHFIADWHNYGDATRKHADFHKALDDFCAEWVACA